MHPRYRLQKLEQIGRKPNKPSHESELSEMPACSQQLSEESGWLSITPFWNGTNVKIIQLEALVEMVKEQIHWLILGFRL
jgi:hypothetical protein